jgi:predicted RNA-binding protein with RPS1 domain
MSDQELAQDEQHVEATSDAAAAPAIEAVAEESAASEEATPEVAEQAEPVAAAEESPAEEPAVAEAESTPADDDEAAADGDEAADDDSQTIFNLEPRQQLNGKVKNITTFGAFVDLGLPQDGLIHISELSRRKVEKVEDVVSVGQDVDVWVKKVDRKRGRISLTMIKPVARRIRDIGEEEELVGTVTRLESFGAFVDIDSERDGLVHISQITHDYIKHPQEALEIGQKVNVKVLKVNRKKRQIDLSIKALLAPPVVEASAEAPSSRATSAKNNEPDFSLQEQEPVPTAMAVAFASLQEENSADDSASGGSGTKESSRRKREQEAIIARLANG